VCLQLNNIRTNFSKSVVFSWFILLLGKLPVAENSVAAVSLYAYHLEKMSGILVQSRPTK
jgi:hypothetical protein